MQLFAAKPNRHILLFGSGLLGQAVRGAVRRAGVAEPQHHPFTWADATAQTRQLTALIPKITGRCDVVWAAGKAGFGAPAEQLAQETDSFLHVLKTLQDALGDRLRMHLISSAGGLYEGQRFVDQASLANPLRPYGQAKLKQEEVLAHQGIAGQIYRTSSVFGYVRDGRQGLISALISDGLTGQVTRIFGIPSTLRDYVYAGDVGRFIAAEALGDRPLTGARLILASGKPSTVDEVIGTVARQLGRPLALQFDLSPSNALHNSYRPGSRPKGFTVTPQELAIAQTIEAVRSGRP
jgi:nucleoside-diphosphate-sugar epimerase